MKAYVTAKDLHRELEHKACTVACMLMEGIRGTAQAGMESVLEAGHCMRHIHDPNANLTPQGETFLNTREAYANCRSYQFLQDKLVDSMCAKS